MVKSQIKFWVFGTVGVIGVYMVLRGWNTDFDVSIGVTMVLAAFGAFILGVAWNVEKDSQQAAMYDKLVRDERAKQAWENVKAEGAKQLESPRKKTKEE